MQHYLNEILYIVNQMQPQHWLIVLAAVIVVGLVCLKGMGTRSHY